MTSPRAFAHSFSAQTETLQWTGVKLAQEFVKLFNAEIENFYASKIPARRPNSMNNYGAQAKKRGVWCMSTSLGEGANYTNSIYSDWWFGTLFIFLYIGNNHPNWLIYFRGVETTNQIWWQFQWGNHWNHDDFLSKPWKTGGTSQWWPTADLSRISSSGTAKENLKNPWNHSWFSLHLNNQWIGFRWKIFTGKKFSDFPMIFFRFPLTCLNRSSCCD